MPRLSPLLMRSRLCPKRASLDPREMPRRFLAHSPERNELIVNMEYDAVMFKEPGNSAHPLSGFVDRNLRGIGSDVSSESKGSKGVKPFVRNRAYVFFLLV